MLFGEFHLSDVFRMKKKGISGNEMYSSDRLMT